MIVDRVALGSSRRTGEDGDAVLLTDRPIISPPDAFVNKKMLTVPGSPVAD